MAEEMGVEGASTMRKQDLMFSVLKVQAENGVEIMGSGTVEVLNDGFGFLRSPEANYLAGPDHRAARSRHNTCVRDAQHRLRHDRPDAPERAPDLHHGGQRPRCRSGKAGGCRPSAPRPRRCCASAWAELRGASGTPSKLEGPQRVSRRPRGRAADRAPLADHGDAGQSGAGAGARPLCRRRRQQHRSDAWPRNRWPRRPSPASTRCITTTWPRPCWHGPSASPNRP